MDYCCRKDQKHAIHNWSYVPIYRYHPAIIAQAFASLDILYPKSIGFGLGTGESMNEVPLGFDWPSPES